MIVRRFSSGVSRAEQAFVRKLGPHAVNVSANSYYPVAPNGRGFSSDAVKPDGVNSHLDAFAPDLFKAKTPARLIYS